MTDDSHEAQRSWLERLSHVLLREPQDREQLIELLHNAKQHQLLDSDALHMIEGVLQVSEMQVRDIMIPRAQMITIDANCQPSDAIPIIIEAGHSRFPVMSDDHDSISGILLAKDLLKYQHSAKAPLIGQLTRPAVFIPESKRLDILLKEFRLNRNHMAIIADEYGGFAGLVTIEDVLEQIVGNIEDEFDKNQEASYIKPVTDNTYSVEALTPIDQFNAQFGSDYSDEEFDTIGGLLLQQLGHVPKPGEAFTFDNFEVTVIQASTRGIQLLKFTQQIDRES